MRRTLILLASAVVMLVSVSLPAASASDDIAIASAHGRHVIALRGGLLNHGRIESSAGISGTKSRVSGFSGFVSYSYGLAAEWNAGVAVGILDADVLASTTPENIISRAASVTPILLEVHWQPLALAMGDMARPFVRVGGGPYVGSATNFVFGQAASGESVTETVPGGCAHAGIDWYLGSRFRVGLSGGYHFVGKFVQPIGTARDYSGAEFNLELGLLLGAMR